MIEKTKFNSGKVLSISAGHFIHDIFSSFLAPFLPLLISKFGFSLLLAGSLTVLFRIPSLFNPWIGVISDRFDLKKIAIWAPAVTAVAMSFLGIAPNYVILCILMLIAGIGSAVFHVVGPVIIAINSGINIGRGMSFWMTAGELARTVGPLLAVGAVTILGFEGSYPVMIIGILCSTGLYFYFKASKPELDKQPLSGGIKETWNELKYFMIPLTGIIIARSFMFVIFTTFLPTYVVNSGKSLWFGGISLAVLELSGTIGTFLGGTLSDRLGRRKILFISIPISSILMLAFVYAPDGMIFPILLLMGFTFFSISPVMLAILQDNSENRRGSANGLYMGINFVTMAIITFFAGGLADIFSLKIVFILSAFIGLAGIPFIFFLPES
ncbi:MFS transporter, FSR family, fosmidomycin resistance protein [Candidatus Magnetomoraceae bacterium gMMP-1]